jgi:ubiquinone/menaquinone biosynthesis C-methylase UbiE
VEWGHDDPEPGLRELLAVAHARRGGRALDLGCGNGRNVGLLRDRGFEVHGVDFAREALATARRRWPAARFLRADVRRLPYAAGRFALAVDVGCLHAVPPRDRRKVVREAARILRRGGLWVVIAFRAARATAEPIHLAAGVLPEWGIAARALRRTFAGWFATVAVRAWPGGRDGRGVFGLVLRREGGG